MNILAGPLRYMTVLVIFLLSIGIGQVSALGEVNPDDPKKEIPSNPADEISDIVENEPEQPAAASGKEPRRRLLKRIGPQPMTQEEREEAERLRKVAAKYGTDPTAIVGRLQLTGQYLDLPQGAQATVTTARVDLPFRGNYLLRMDMPFLRTTDPNRSGSTGQRGVSDLAVTAGWRAYNTPEYAVLVGVMTTMPTAETGLGLGKYTIGPTLATARFVPQLDSFLIGLLQYRTSVGGEPSGRDLSLLNVAAQVNSFWGRQWWTVVQAVWQVDFERSRKSSMTMEFEGGRNLVGRLGAYIRPGVGIWGRDVAGAYDWNIEVGIRYMFGSF